MSLRAALKRLWFGLRGVDPEAVVAVFRTGRADLCDAMEAEFRALLPDRRCFVVDSPATPSELRRRFRGLRIGMSAVMFDGDPAHRASRRAAFLLAPGKVLAYNARLERHHLQASSPVASLLFWRGVPLDRIWLRPWFWPGRGRPNPPPPALPESVTAGRAQSATRAQVSVLSPYYPWPLSHGGAVRIYNLLRECSKHFDITLFAFTEGAEPLDLEPMRAICAKIVTAPKPHSIEPRWSTLAPPEVGEYRSAAMTRLIREHAARPLQVEYTQLAPYGGDILVEHDVTFDLYRQVHERRRTLSSWWDWFRWRSFERRVLSRAQQVVVMSAKDAKIAARPDATVIPNGVDLERFAPSLEAPADRILFIGSFRHFPNVVAYRYLTEQVLPRIRAQHPGARLTVVAGPDPKLHWRAVAGTLEWPRIDGVEMHEFVADVRPLYREANVVVVPTLESAGTNVKVLEAMAMQRAVVSTPTGCAGLDLRDGHDTLIADTPDAFASAVSRLLADPALRAHIAAEGRRTVEERFSWTASARRQCAMWDRLAPATMGIRDSVPEDAEAIRRIVDASNEAAGWAPEHCLVADCNGVIAFLATRTTTPDEHEVLNIAVDPAWRRHGVGRRLLEAWLASVRGDVFLEVRDSNHAARRLYESLGFTAEGRRPAYYHDPPEDAVTMRLIAR